MYIMENFVRRYRKKIERIDTHFVRSLINDINWNARLIAIHETQFRREY
jgi:hypothetical protein